MAQHRQNTARQQEKEEAGPLKDKFRKVTRIRIDMTYYRAQENPILMERTVNYYPESPALFRMPCMIPDCEEGDFDLTRIVGGMVRRKSRSKKGSMKCSGGSGLPADHASIDYHITINYSRAKS